MNPTLFLGIETSCDETAAAVFTDEPAVLANVVASQTDLHARFGGVVPEVAARAHLQRLLPVIDEALRQADVRLDQIGGVAVHHTPGLVGALLVGVSAAKMLAVALDVPLLGVNHVHGHIYACRLAAGRDIFPCVGLVVSGGHTTLFHCRDAVYLRAPRRHAGRRGRRGVRQGGQPARPRLSRRPGRRTRGGGRRPHGRPPAALLPARRPARFQLQRSENGGIVRPGRPERGAARRRPLRASAAPTWRPAFRRRWWTC